MKKILFLMPNWNAVSEQWMQYMMQSLGSNLAVICVLDTEQGTLWNNRVPVISLSSINIAKKIVFKLQKINFEEQQKEIWSNKLKNVIRKIKPDAIFGHFGPFMAGFEDVWKQFDIPLFVHFHGLDVHTESKTHENPEVFYFQNEYVEKIRILANLSTFFIANSQFTRQKLIQNFGIPENKIKVKYLSTPVTEEKIYHTRTENIQILHLGRLVDFKSPDRTIMAFEKACDQGLNGTLIIAGDGPLRVTCELMRMRSPYRERIKMLGAVSAEQGNMLRLSSDIFTQHNVIGELTKQQESLGVSILEAMSIGLPVVSTKSGGVLETVIDGETGILVEPGDIEGQAAAFLTLSRNPELRNCMAKAGRERIAKYFNTDIETKLFKEIMDL